MKKLVNLEIIENFLKENNLSKTKFCKMCNVSYSTFKKIMSHDYKFSIFALFKIARVMNISVAEIFLE